MQLSTTQSIRSALQEVAALRAKINADPAWREAVMHIKRFQCRRFAKAYAHMADDKRQGPALQFFLTDLYAAKDFSERDAQFGRIAGAIEKLFPAEVAQTAWALADVHGLSERLDAAMARAWLDAGSPELNAASYLKAWRSVGESENRQRQLQTVLQLGRQLDAHTRTRGLRTLLRMMRGPAGAAGLSELQAFLEHGFDTFKGLGGAGAFLAEIERNEAAFIDLCCHAPLAQAQEGFEDKI
jgi:hypothetical protein